MIGEKIKYYRKKNMFSQETLAEKLNVSRQIISKWEADISIPSIESLIIMSDLFGVTIDTLVKDNDCETLETQIVNFEKLVFFLVEAKKNTYASQKNKVISSRKLSHDYYYENNDYKYLDSFVGSSCFSGQEVVYNLENVIWSMNYFGKVLNEAFDGVFLKEALLHISIDKPFRGPEYYSKGEYHYYNNVVGDINFFYGKEIIFYNDIKVYECLYIGGIIK